MKNETSYQRWINPALKKSGISLKELALKAEMDYSALWKIARGNPATYPGSSRPEYDNAVKIGELLGDVEGSLEAAGYTSATSAVESLAVELSQLDADDQQYILNLIRRLSASRGQQSAEPAPTEQQ